MSDSMRRPDMAPNKVAPDQLEMQARTTTFEEVEQNYRTGQAVLEAERCMDCPGRYCERDCPLHVPIPDVLLLVRQGDYEGAYQLIRSKNPMPGITGRVCPQEKQCESNCTRSIKAEAVAFGRVERFLTQWHWEQAAAADTRPRPQNGRRVAVIGSGPAGLACADKLAGAGCWVEVFERRSRSGGAAGCEIPAFVLPQAAVDQTLREIEARGVILHTDCGIDDLDDLCQRFDAVFVATGAATPVALETDMALPEDVVQAQDYLTAPQRPRSRRVLVIGGGDTAMDAARTALRDGAEQTVVVYRRSEAELPARSHDLAQAMEEGVQLCTLLSPLRFDGEHGKLERATFCKMELAAPDYPGGRRNVVCGTETVTIEADMVILALGFRPSPVKNLPVDGQNRPIVAKDGVTTPYPGIFAGGDVVSGPSTVAKAAASGISAAQAILKYLECEPG